MRKLILLIFTLLLGINASWAHVTSTSGIKANKCYTVTTPSRGSWTMKTDGSALASTSKISEAVSSSNPNQQWAFVDISGSTYLYNVGTEKFILKNDDQGTAQTKNATPIEMYQYTSEEMAGWGESAYYETWQSEGYLFNAKFGLSGSYTAYINFGGSNNVQINAWGPGNTEYENMCGADAGNCLKIEEVADFNPSEIINSVCNSWSITSSDLTTNFWKAMGGDAPAGVTALGSYTPYSRTQNITLTNPGFLEVTFTWETGGDRLEILGVDLLDGEDNVVKSDYHYGYAGSPNNKNVYLLSGLASGSYKLRYIINKDTNLDDSKGTISISKPIIKVADSFANISQWYVLRVHTNSGYYMYYDSEATYKYGFTTSSSDINTNSYLWGFVEEDGGLQIYNKAAGSSLALDDANPSTISASGIAADFGFKVGKGTVGSLGADADAYFTLTHTSGNALNYNYGNKRLQQWSGSDAGSTFMIYEAETPTSISFTLTDMNGATYTGTYTGMVGVTEPPIVGCVNYTLSNKVWSGSTFTADITFPFDVSSNAKENATTLRSALGTSLWYAKDGKVIADNLAKTPSTFYDTFADNYLWYIYPVYTSGTKTFQFALYNVGAKKYIPNDPSQAVGTATTLTDDLQKVGGFYFSHYNAGNGFYDNSTSKYLTINTSGTAQNIWLWSAPSGTSHQGSVMSFPTLTIVNVATTFDALKNAEKLDILEGSTVMGPGEFAAPTAINDAIDAANEVADNADAKITFIESDNGTKIQNYLNQVATYGEPVSVKITMSREYGTMILPAGCARVDGLDIYSVSAAVGNILTLTPVEGNYAAKTPYIIHATEGSKYTLVCWNTNSGTATAGWLPGVLPSTTEIPSGSYMLATKKDTGYQAFYQVSGTGVLCAQYKCYLTVPSGDVKAFFLDIDGQETAIGEIFGDKVEQDTIYNLAGQRMSRVQKGVNIVNGKKVLVK